MKTTKFALALTLSLIGVIAQAAVEVRFVDVDKFSDIRDANYQRQDDLLKQIQEHFQQLGDKQLPGKDLKIEVTDVDLAGRVEPRGRRMEMFRILKDIGDGPAIRLNYVLSANGLEIRRGEAQLRDMGYMMGYNRYSEGDPLRYEKRMIDAWFAKEFAPEGASR